MITFRIKIVVIKIGNNLENVPI